MKKSGWQVLVYAVVVGLGGIVGKVKAGSTPSLLFGLLFACLLGVSASLMIQGKRIGAIYAIVCTLALDAFFTYRFMLSYKFMPAGMMSLMSLGMLLMLVNNLKPKKSRDDCATRFGDKI